MAWTTPRTWTDGELVTAAIMNAHVRDNLDTVMHTLAYKTADETVNNSAVYQDDNDLLFAVDTNEVWYVQAWLKCDSTTAADIKFTWTVPASGAIKWGAIGDTGLSGQWEAKGVATTTSILLNATEDLAAGANSTGTIFGVSMAGIATTAGTAGNVQLQWAQNSATAVNTIVKANSFLVGMKLA